MLTEQQITLLKELIVTYVHAEVKLTWQKLDEEDKLIDAACEVDRLRIRLHNYINTL